MGECNRLHRELDRQWLDGYENNQSEYLAGSFLNDIDSKRVKP
jgi:hypothetical protein